MTSLAPHRSILVCVGECIGVLAMAACAPFSSPRACQSSKIFPISISSTANIRLPPKKKKLNPWTKINRKFLSPLPDTIKTAWLLGLNLRPKIILRGEKKLSFCCRFWHVCVWGDSSKGGSKTNATVSFMPPCRGGEGWGWRLRWRQPPPTTSAAFCTTVAQLASSRAERRVLAGVSRTVAPEHTGLHRRLQLI